MKKTTITLGIALIGLAGIGYYHFYGSQSSKLVQPESISAKPLPEAKPSASKLNLGQKVPANHEARPHNQPRAKGAASSSQQKGTEWTTAQIEEDYVKAFQRYPHLRENAMYASKALLSDDEMANWRKSLQSETLIAETIQDLSDHYNPDYDLEGSIVNQERIKFLKYSAQLAGNPASPKLFAGIESFITDTEMDTADFSDQLKRDVAGDKIELIYIYQAFKKGGKERLDELAAQSPKFRKLLEYARENSQHLNRIL